MNTEVNTEVRTEVNTEVRTELNTVLRTELNTVLRTELRTEAKTEQPRSPLLTIYTENRQNRSLLNLVCRFMR